MGVGLPLEDWQVVFYIIIIIVVVLKRVSSSVLMVWIYMVDSGDSLLHTYTAYESKRTKCIKHIDTILR